MTGEEPEVFLGVDPAGIGAPFVAGRRADGVLVLQDETAWFKPKPLPDFSDWARIARTRGVLKLETFIQQPTLDALSRSFESAGRAAGKTARMLEILTRHLNQRAVRPVPPTVPPGLSRVESARRRSARSALLRERRRALRHNRKNPPPRTRARMKITVFDPKVTQNVAERLRSGAIHITPGI